MKPCCLLLTLKAGRGVAHSAVPDDVISVSLTELAAHRKDSDGHSAQAAASPRRQGRDGAVGRRMPPRVNLRGRAAHPVARSREEAPAAPR